MKKSLITFLIILCKQIANEASITGNWGYVTTNNSVGPLDWNTIFPNCDGYRQSPIDIQTKYAKYVPNMLPISVEKLKDSVNNFRLEKSSTTINLFFNDNWKITFDDEKCLKPFAIHWHWGSNNNQGSDHHLNGKIYPLEGHLVLFNCAKYNSYEIAKDSENGLYVISVLYKMHSRTILTINEKSEILCFSQKNTKYTHVELSKHFSKKFGKIISRRATGDLIQKKTITIGNSNPILETISSLMETDLWKATGSTNTIKIKLDEILPKHLNNYYQYDGSLTTPPCTENVKWIILDEELTVSESQLKELRKLKFDPPNAGNLMDNFRPIIANRNNARSIYRSFKIGIMQKMRTEFFLTEIAAIFFFFFNPY